MRKFTGWGVLEAHCSDCRLEDSKVIGPFLTLEEAEVFASSHTGDGCIFGQNVVVPMYTADWTQA